MNDVISAQWSIVPAHGTTPTARAGHSATYHANSRRIFVFGGENGVKQFNEMFAFDTIQLTWSKLAPNGLSPTARHGHASAVIGDKWYIFGGNVFSIPS